MVLLRKLKSVSDTLGVSNSFALANVFAFALSGSLVGLGIAVATGFVSWRAGVYASRNNAAPANTYQRLENRIFASAQRLLLGRKAKSEHLGLRVNAWGMAIAAVATGGLTLLTGGFGVALFPVLAGASFAVGNYFGSSENILAIQKGDKPARGFTRAITNPAVYYGIGYINLGLVAGGGLNLFANPLANVVALATTTLSTLATAASVAGLVTKKIKNPVPFMFVAHGTAFSVLSALATGNVLSVFNNIFACHGEVKLGMILREVEAKPKPVVHTPDIISETTQTIVARPNIADLCFDNLSYVVCWPVRALDRIAAPKVFCV